MTYKKYTCTKFNLKHFYIMSLEVVFSQWTELEYEQQRSVSTFREEKLFTNKVNVNFSLNLWNLFN